MTIGIDARLWSESGVGRYIRNLVRGIDALEAKNPQNNYIVFLRKKDFDSVSFVSDSFEKKVADIQWHSVNEQLALPKIIEKADVDLMHFPYFSIPLSYKKPFVITIHDLIIKNFPTGKASTLPSPLYYVKHAMYNKVLTHGIQNSRSIIVPSEYVKKDVLNSFDVPEDKITVTYEGVDDLIDSSQLTVHGSQLENLQDIQYFLYVGNAYPHKNVEFLIDGFAQFIKDNPQHSGAHLVLVGREDYFYKRLKKTIDPGLNILFLHDIDDNQLAYLYSHAVSFVTASKAEGFGLQLPEAMQLGCPVICSDIPVFKEIGAKAAIYFNLAKKENLAQVLKSVMQMSERDKKTLRDLGKKRAKSFSWDTMVKQTVAVYASFLK